MEKPDLSGLVGARICHDLISPIGAIGNGVELLGLSGPPSPELRLISESVAGASAKVKFLRIAFGRSDTGQMNGPDEIRHILRETEATGRISFDWQITEPSSRAETRCAFLSLLCAQAAMPAGGRITISASGGIWHIYGLTETVRLETGLWSILNGDAPGSDLAPSDVQFALLPQAARAIGRSVQGAQQRDGVAITF